METKRGGKREGAGRKPGLASVASEEARSYVMSRIYEEIEPIIAGQIELAKGIYSDKNRDGEIVKVYRKLPDVKVAEYLLSQLIGLPKVASVLQDKPKYTMTEEHKAKINRILGITN